MCILHGFANSCSSVDADSWNYLCIHFKSVSRSFYALQQVTPQPLTVSQAAFIDFIYLLLVFNPLPFTPKLLDSTVFCSALLLENSGLAARIDRSHCWFPFHKAFCNSSPWEVIIRSFMVDECLKRPLCLFLCFTEHLPWQQPLLQPGNHSTRKDQEGFLSLMLFCSPVFLLLRVSQSPHLMSVLTCTKLTKILWLVSSTVSTSQHFALVSAFFARRKKLMVSVRLLVQGTSCVLLPAHFNSHCILWLCVWCKKIIGCVICSLTNSASVSAAL